MIRRSVKSGLLASVAVLALLPTAAGAAEASHAVSRPAPAVVVPYIPAALLPAPAQYMPVRHHTQRTIHRLYRTKHCARRAHRTARATAYYPVSYSRTVNPLGRVATHRFALNVRSGPGTGYRVVGHRHGNRLVRLICKTYGSGVYGNHTWYRLAHHRGYVSGHYMRVRAAVPWC